MGRRKKHQLPEANLPAGLFSALIAEMAGDEGLGVSEDPADGGWTGDPAQECWDRATLEKHIGELEQKEIDAHNIRRAMELVGPAFKITATTPRRSGPKEMDSDEIIDAICWAYYCKWYRSGKTSWRAAIASTFPNFHRMGAEDQNACYRRLMNRVATEADRRLVRITWSHDWQPLRDGGNSTPPALEKNDESRRK